MAAPKIDSQYFIARIPEHVGELPPEAASPIAHYERGASDAWNLLNYFGSTAQRAKGYKAPFERHVVRLRSLVLFALVESFERFGK